MSQEEHDGRIDGEGDLQFSWRSGVPFRGSEWQRVCRVVGSLAMERRAKRGPAAVWERSSKRS